MVIEVGTANDNRHIGGIGALATTAATVLLIAKFAGDAPAEADQLVG